MFGYQLVFHNGHVYFIWHNFMNLAKTPYDIKTIVFHEIIWFCMRSKCKEKYFKILREKISSKDHNMDKRDLSSIFTTKIHSLFD